MATALRTYLFTDLLGYGELLQTEGDRAATRLVHAYRGVVTGQIQRVRTATLQEVAGDTIYAAFRLPDDAIRAALAIARDIRAYNERKPAVPIRVGIGVHAGQTVRLGRDYIGSAVALASRLSHAAQPGQILITDTVFGLVRTLEIAPMRDLGVWGPHGLGQTAHVYEVVPPEEQPSGPNLQGHVNRALLTILFTDIARSTDREVALGDRQWADLIQRHHALIRGEIRRHQGREVDTAGDGFFVTFEAPSRAIECALGIRDGIRTLGLELRLGIHVGEVEIMAGKVGGVAVTTASRTREAAQPGEILVSQTVRDLVSGGPFEFGSARLRSLKGIPGKWRLYSVASRPTV